MRLLLSTVGALGDVEMKVDDLEPRVDALETVASK